MKTFRLSKLNATILALAALIVAAQGQVQVAGTLLVEINPTGASLHRSPGSQTPAHWAGLSGLGAGGGGPAGGRRRSGGAKGIVFDGHNFMEHVAAPGGAIVPLSATPLAGK